MNDEQQKTIGIFLKWLSISQEFLGSFPEDVDRLRINMEHSALLQRLMSGKEAFEVPPPKSFSSPWYDLFDNGSAKPLCVSEVKETYDDDIDIGLNVDQTIWKVLAKPEEDTWLVTYKYRHGNEYKFHPGVWKVYKIGSRIPRQYKGSIPYLWKIERLK